MMILLFICVVVVAAARASDDAWFEEAVRRSPRACLVEFYSSMCGSCQEFEETWFKLSKQASRLESMRIDIDETDGESIAHRLGILDRGVPAVLLFDTTNSFQFVMAGDIFPLSRLLKRVYRATKGQNLQVDREGYFLKKQEIPSL